MITSNLIIYSTFILDCELKLSAKDMELSHKHQQLSLLNNKLERSDKLLESNVTKLNQTTEKWKKGNSLDEKYTIVPVVVPSAISINDVMDNRIY